MKVLLWLAALVLLCCSPALAIQRTYYIAADEVLWNYAPTGTNVLTGALLKPDKNQLGFTYRKIVYHEYVDGTFAQTKQRADADRYMGILGPPDSR